MDPYYEQRLRDEVIYLHSLWRQGPPLRPPSNNYIHPLHFTRFKKHNKKNPNFHTFQPKKVGNFSGTEWPVKPSSENNPPLNQSGWPELKLKPKPTPVTRLPTPEELAKHNWNQIQQKALQIAKDFYSKTVNSDGEVSDEEEDDDDDMDEDEDVDSFEDKECIFFGNLFDEDKELKGYYVKNCGGGGEFACLVCEGANEKLGKRFKDCIALVQHSISIAKTKKKRSHRAFGKVVCKVLGWDIDRLPSSVVSDFKSTELQGNDVDVDKDSNVGPSDVGFNKIIGNEDSNLAVDSMVCESSSGAACVEVEENRKLDSNEAEGNASGVVNNLCTNLSTTMVLEAPGQTKIKDSS